MNIARFLTEQRIDLSLDGIFDEDTEPSRDVVLEHMADLLEQSTVIVNATKMRQELLNSQRRTPTLVGEGLFLPHVRTMQARRLTMAVAVSQNGLDLGAPDDEPIRLVIAMVGPTYDDKQYLQVYKRLSVRLQSPGAIERVVAAEQPGVVLRELSS
ncbi:MAG: PTS system nitrogen regulatory IIA component [Pseudohongiellaceae bacterium]